MLKDCLLISAVSIVAAVLVASVITMATTRITEERLPGDCSKLSVSSWFGTVLHYDKIVCGDERKKIVNKRRPFSF